MRPSAAGPGRTSGAGDWGLALPRDHRAWERSHPVLWDEVQERIAILVFDAKMSTERAERAAVQIVLERHGLA